MAKVTAPLLSLGASGKIANTLVASVWKGIPYMRQYVVPANPQTTDQVAHRNAFTAAVAAWRNYITGALAREAWRVWAGIQSGAMSNFNGAVGNLVTALKADADASFMTLWAEASQVVTITMKNMDDGATGDEAGDFIPWIGTTPTNLIAGAALTIAAGALTTADLGASGDVVYLDIRKGGVSRSGIIKVTLTT